MNSNTILQAFGRCIRRRRLANGITQFELASRSQLTCVFISSIEQGKRNPSLLTIAKLAAAFDLKVYEIFDDEFIYCTYLSSVFQGGADNMG